MHFNPLPIILSAVGVYFLIKLRFFFIIHPIRTAQKTLRAVKDKRVMKSITLALAGTLGVGNVFGVAVGIIIGGAGSLFWLLVSMIFAMVIKYAEVVITADNLHHDTDAHGGMFFVIRATFKRLGGTLSRLYALGVLLLSLLMGATLQCNTVVESAWEIVGAPRYLTAMLVAVLALGAIIGGAGKIEKVTSVVIPLTTIIYILISFAVIIVNFDRMGDVVKQIVLSAFSWRSGVGGALAFLFAAPFQEGFLRGVLSNEAGAGTSSMAHARSGILNPASQGLLGIFEVWFDTGFICVLTGLSILLSVPDISTFDGGMQIIMYSVGSVLGSAGKYATLISVFAFAFATVICWYYYGMESWAFAFGKKRRIFYLPLFLLFVVFGGVLNSFLVISIIDLLMALITALTLSALIKCSDRIRALSERGGVMNFNPRRVSSRRIRGNGALRERVHRGLK